MTSSLLALLLLPVVGSAAVVMLRALDARAAVEQLQTYRLRFPRGMQAEEVMVFLSGLAGIRPPWFLVWLQQPVVVFETHAREGKIEHRLIVPARLSDRALAHLRAALPSVRLEQQPTDALPRSTRARELQLSTTARPLRTDRPAGASAALLMSLLPLGPEEEVVVSWAVSPSVVPKPPRLSGREPSRRSTTLPETEPYMITTHSEALDAEQAKQAELPFQVVGRIGVSAASPTRATHLLGRVETAYRMLSAPGVALEPRRLISSKRVADRLVRRHVPAIGWPAWLNGAEVMNVIGWPIDAAQLPGVDLGGCRQLPPAADIPSTGYVVATATFPGSERPIAIADTDRYTHVSITGPTGSGKSNLLLSLIVSDMQRGRGAVVVDVKGDLIEECLKRVPDDRIEDVVLVDPSDIERPVGLNFLSTESASKELVADQVTATFHLLFESFWGPRSDDLLRASLLTLMHDPKMTMVELVPLLVSEPFRRRFVEMVKDDKIGLGPFWSTYVALRPNEQAQVISPLMNKLRQVLLRPAVRNSVGQSTSKLDFATAINSGKLVFLRLPEGLIGDEAASLLGSLLVSRVWSAAQARIGLPEEERLPTTLYIDEAHRLVGSAIGLDNMLAQARAVRMSTVLATQHLSQYDTELREAVLSNARSKIVFQPTATDARRFEAEFRPALTSEDLQGLGRFEVVAQLAVGQRVAPPVTAVTLPPSDETGNEDRCRDWSRTHYGRSREDIESEMKARHSTATTAAPIGRQRKRGAS